MKTVTLRIKKVELDLIRAGTKKHEWRKPSKYYWSLLGRERADGKKEANPDIIEIQFINGYAKDAPRLQIKVKRILMIKAVKDYRIPYNFIVPDFNCHSHEYYTKLPPLIGNDKSQTLLKKGQYAIEISLGDIIQ